MRKTSGQSQRVPRDQGVMRMERAIAGFRRGADRLPGRRRQQAARPDPDHAVERLLDEYRRLHARHRRARPGSRARRRLGSRLSELRGRFERTPSGPVERRSEPQAEPVISVRGPVTEEMRHRIARALADSAAHAPRPVRRLSASVTRSEDPANATPVTLKATIEAGGRSVHANASAASEIEALGLLEARLRRNLRALVEREVTNRHRPQPVR